MPARDIYHDNVKAALVKDGWTITHDPLTLPFGRRTNLYVDLGAQRLIAASKENQKIAVEIKNFVGKSEIDDLEDALGKYVLYLSLLEEKEPDRTLFLAVTRETFGSVFSEPSGQVLIRKLNLRIIVFDDKKEEIIKWIP
jgi:hypothetical protein